MTTVIVREYRCCNISNINSIGYTHTITTYLSREKNEQFGLKDGLRKATKKGPIMSLSWSYRYLIAKITLGLCVLSCG